MVLPYAVYLRMYLVVWRVLSLSEHLQISCETSLSTIL